MKVNFLVNYGWEWDLAGLKVGALQSADVSQLDRIVRWGGGRRLSGFLPVQSVYADIGALVVGQARSDVRRLTRREFHGSRGRS